MTGRLATIASVVFAASTIASAVAAEPSLQNTADGYAPRPDYRPLTKFEQRGLRLGHGVWDVIFRKKPGKSS